LRSTAPPSGSWPTDFISAGTTWSGFGLRNRVRVRVRVQVRVRVSGQGQVRVRVHQREEDEREDRDLQERRVGGGDGLVERRGLLDDASGEDGAP
jgi:hypothetical protein